MASERCRGAHRLLMAREFNAHGAVVDCLLCGDTFQIKESTLSDRYYHASGLRMVPASGPEEMNFFIFCDLVEEPKVSIT